MLDLIIRNATLPDGRQGVDIGIEEGRIAVLKPKLEAQAGREIHADGYLVTPPLVDSHFHMDATLSLGRPRHNESGTLLEGIQIWAEQQPMLTAEDIKTRAATQCRWAIARGCLAVRSHVDIADPALTAVEALLELRDEMRPWLDLQLVAFPQNGYFRDQGAVENMKRALDLGVEVVGGIPHFERTMAEGAASVKALCEIAAARGLLVDMHCDESDDPLSRHIESLTFEAQRLGLQGRVTGSHLTSMHAMDNYYVSKLLPLMREAGVAAVANPLINITLQGRYDSYPKRRGMTRVKELLKTGINVGLGHDCVMDPWYSLGSHDMLEVAHMALHVGHMTGRAEIREIFSCITARGARLMHLPDYGLAPGCHGDLVVFQARDCIEAIRLRATRLYVVRRGKVIATSPPQVAQLDLGGARRDVDFLA